MSFQGGRTIFGRVPEKNVYFLIDTSGSMYHQLAFVKQHLIELLSNRATVSQDSMFNVIEFKEEVDKWADKLVQCTPSTVTVAARWINKLTCGTSTNTMGALLEALNDSAVEAIYMVTDGLPDQRPTVILEKLRSIPYSTPIHSIYLNGTYSDPATHGFLRDLAEQTRGSFHTVTLSHNGSVEKVVPVYNTKTGYVQHYDISLDKLGRNDVESKYIDLEKPPASGYVSRIYEKSPITAVDTSLCLPVSYGSYNGHCTSGGSTMDSKVLDYADAVIEARGLAKAAGIRCCSIPVACSLMKGMRVLARHDRDGLYYFGEVKEQGPNDSFVVKFDACSTVRKAVVQETSVHHMIAYKDAIRSHVALGDKVLAPWQQDGCYGPGTVLEGVDRRDAQTEGCEDGRLLVTFFNGETVELQPGIAVRIPKDTFDRIVKELQLPESQRRKLTFCERNIPLTFASVAPPQSLPPAERYTSAVHKRAWEHSEQTKKESDKLRKRVDDQINENSYLLHALDLTSGIRSPKVIGKATSRDIPNYDSGVFSEDESGTSDDDSRRMSYDDDFRFDHEVGTRHKEYDLGFSTRFSLPEAKVLSKSGGKVEPTKRWRWWSTGVPARQPRFRETLLRKPREPGEKLTNTVRPTHEEYQTVAGVSFPAGTDRKFGSERQQWHPYRQFSVHRKENVSTAVGERKHQKHSEYQDVAGVGFPRATDKKFTQSLDPNWRPETALRNAERSQNWEDGLGHGDVQKNAQYADKLERKRSNKRRYFKDIEDKVAIEEKKEAKRTEFRRNKMTQRDVNLAESEAEKNRQIAERMENKAAKQGEILRSEKERTDKAEKWKTTRIEVRRNRQAKYFEIEGNYESDEQARVARREVRRRNIESKRREEFHERLREEWRTEDERVEFLRQRNEANREKASKRQQDQEQIKQARFSAKQERLEKYRASILP